MVEIITAKEARVIANYDGDIGLELKCIEGHIKWSAAEKKFEVRVDGVSDNAAIILKANGFGVYSSYEDDGTTTINWEEKING